MSALVDLYTKLFFTTADSLVELAEDDLKEITDWWFNFFSLKFKPNQLDETIKMADKIIKFYKMDKEDIKFMLPEAKGRLLYLLTDPTLLEIEERNMERYRIQTDGGFSFINPFNKEISEELIQRLEKAIIIILGYIQSESEYLNVLQHMSDSIKKEDIDERKERLFNKLGVCGRSQLKMLDHFKLKLDNGRGTVEYTNNKYEIYDTPVIFNNTVREILKKYKI